MKTHRKLSIIQYEIQLPEFHVPLRTRWYHTPWYNKIYPFYYCSTVSSQKRTTEKWSNTYLAIYQSDRKKYLEQSLCDPWGIFHILQSQNPTILVWHLHSLTPSHWKLGEILPVKQNMDLLITSTTLNGSLTIPSPQICAQWTYENHRNTALSDSYWKSSQTSLTLPCINTYTFPANFVT